MPKVLNINDKRKIMLQDLEDELKQYKGKKNMEWWVMRLEHKIKEIKDGNANT